jgi:quaternary ammonium compound-resistance protein SugE
MGVFFLILSGLCDAIWNIYLSKSKGISDWQTNIVGVFFLIFSTIGFKKALDTMPLSVVVVVWSGLSIIFTIALDMYIFKTKIDYKIAFFMGMCIVSILGLNYYSTR